MMTVLRASALVWAALLFLPGCSKPLDPGTGVELTGTITLDGKPLDIGMIIVFPASDMAKANQATTQLSAEKEGKYTVTGAPLGSVKIVVMTRQLKGMMEAMSKSKGSPTKGGAPAGPTGHFVDIPAIYQESATTPLVTTLEKGQNTFNIELKSKP